MIFRSVSHFITDAGDSGFLLPMVLVGSGLLWRYHSRQLAWLLIRSVCVASLAIIGLKLLFLSCGFDWIGDLHSPSGHACLSMVTYGTLAAILAQGRSATAQWLIGLTALLLIVVISISRLTLRVHTEVEVLVGLLVGLASLAWFVRSLSSIKGFRVDAVRFGFGFGVTTVLAFGVRFPAESVIRHLARHLSHSC